MLLSGSQDVFFRTARNLSLVCCGTSSVTSTVIPSRMTQMFFQISCCGIQPTRKRLFSMTTSRTRSSFLSLLFPLLFFRTPKGARGDFYRPKSGLCSCGPDFQECVLLVYLFFKAVWQDDRALRSPVSALRSWVRIQLCTFCAHRRHI